MKIRYLLSTVALTLTLATGIAIAGFVQPAPVVIDLGNMIATGDQWTARSASNDVDFIGCGVRVIDDGVNPPFAFGFCQAGDSDEEQITCFTQSPNLLNTMGASSAFAFIDFHWRDDGFGGAECTRIGLSTQSFYLPDFKTNDADSDSDSDSDSD